MIACPFRGKCFYCFYPKKCHEKYNRPFDKNFDDHYAGLQRVIEVRSVEEKKEEKKPNWVYRASLWTYWQIAQIVWAVLKALNSLRKK